MRDDELVIAPVPLTLLIATLPVDLSAVSYLLHSVISHRTPSIVWECDEFFFYSRLRKELLRKVKRARVWI